MAGSPCALSCACAQEFAWTEDSLPVRKAERGSSLSTEAAAKLAMEPMFCFEVARQRFNKHARPDILRCRCCSFPSGQSLSSVGPRSKGLGPNMKARVLPQRRPAFTSRHCLRRHRLQPRLQVILSDAADVAEDAVLDSPCVQGRRGENINMHVHSITDHAVPVCAQTLPALLSCWKC